MIVLWFAGLAILIFALWQASVWVQNWQIKRNEEKQHRRRQHYYERYPNIKKRDPFAIRAHVQAIADQLQGYREQQERSERRRAARENLTIVGIFITAALALGQGWIFYNQLNEMQEDRRAWVGPYQAGFEGTLMPNMPIAVHVQYQNTGREPALDAFYDLEHFTVNIADDQAGVTVRRIATYVGRCFATPPREGYCCLSDYGIFQLYIEKRNLP